MSIYNHKVEFALQVLFDRLCINDLWVLGLRILVVHFLLGLAVHGHTVRGDKLVRPALHDELIVVSRQKMHEPREVKWFVEFYGQNLLVE